MTDESRTRSLPAGGSHLQDLAGSIAAVMIGLCATLIPFLTNPRFFFNDDQQNQHYAYFIDIGQHLRHHQWPGLTLSTFYGGNLIDDWQYELFNPVSLLTYWIISSMQNLLLVGLFVIGLYLTLFALGSYWLGRIFGLSRIFSLTFAAGLATNNFIQYMYCDSWSMGLISLTWFSWAWVFLEQYRKSGHTLTLGILVCLIYLTITSGWPHTMLMLGVLLLGNMAELVFVQHQRQRALKILLVSIGVLLAAEPYLRPALLSYSWMTRPSGIHSTGLFMVDLGSVLNLSSITLIPRLHLYGHEYPSYPMLYLAWFILPLLPLISWRTGWEMLRKRLDLIIFVCPAVFMLFGPESVGPIRYPIRFLPYIHIALLLSFLLTVSIPGIFRLSRARLACVLAVLFFQLTSSVSVFPDLLISHLFGAGLSAVMILIAVRLIQFKNMSFLGLLFLAGTMLVFGRTHLISRGNYDLADFGASIENNTANPTVAKPFSGYQLFIGPMVYDNSNDVRVAAQGIYSGLYTINGYCALGHVGLPPGPFGYNWFEMRYTNGIDILLGTESTTHKTLVSLMRVNRLLIFNGYLNYAKPLLGPGWIASTKGQYATVMENASPNYADSTLSFASDGIVVKPHGGTTGEEEQMQVTTNLKGGQLVFARLFWPGYEAQLDGKPVAVKPLDNIFVKLDLPPGALGELTLRFVPPGFKLGLVLASIGVLLCCATLLINNKEDGVRIS